MQEINIEGLQSHLKGKGLKFWIKFTMRNISNASTIYCHWVSKFVCPSFLPRSIFNEIYSHSLHSNNRTQFDLGRFKFLQIVLKLLTCSSFDMLRWNADQTYLTLTKFFVLLGKLQGELKYTSCKGKSYSTHQLETIAKKEGESMMLHVLGKK